MALQDILAAIQAEADKQITSARSAHQQTLSRMRKHSEQSLENKRQEIASQKDQKIQQMRRKAEVHTQTQKRNMLLGTKRELLDTVYAQVIQKLAALPDNAVEPLLKACLGQIHAKGELRPTKKHAALLRKLATASNFTFGPEVEASGGFVFISDKQEQDFRFETLVQTMLRPKTELDTARSLL